MLCVPEVHIGNVIRKQYLHDESNRLAACLLACPLTASRSLLEILVGRHSSTLGWDRARTVHAVWAHQELQLILSCLHHHAPPCHLQHQQRHVRGYHHTECDSQRRTKDTLSYIAHKATGSACVLACTTPCDQKTSCTLHKTLCG